MWAGGFLDNRLLPLGQFGALLQRGRDPVMSVLLGIKVGCELSVIVDALSGLNGRKAERRWAFARFRPCVLATGFCLIVIGLWGLLTHRNILRIIIGFSLIDTGIHIVIVAIGYVAGGTAPIVDAALSIAAAPCCARSIPSPPRWW